MRIKRVKVEKLFGKLTHTIPMHDSRITIIIGENGIGKTILLTMIHGLFNSQYEVFYDIPFGTFRVEFVEGQCIQVSKSTVTETDDTRGDLHDSGEPKKKDAKLSISYFDTSDEEYVPYNLKSAEEYRKHFREEVDGISDIHQMDSNLWFNRETGAVLTAAEIVKTYKLESKLYGNQPPWFSEVTDKVRTIFIPAHRLLGKVVAEPSIPFFLRSRSRPDSGTAVEAYSKDIVEEIQTTSRKYGELAQARDGSFPDRVISQSGSSEIDPEIRRQLDDLEFERRKLTELGLLEIDAPKVPESERIVEDLAEAFFATYIQDSEEKLAQFDDIFERLTTLTEIINKRFHPKTLVVDRSKGFSVIAEDGSPISVASLSSGEQHELVLLYQLLFHVKPDSTVMIDEPELSLHVTWQKNFLSDILRVTEIQKFDVLLATHSPQIIWDKRELMVSLGRSNGA